MFLKNTRQILIIGLFLTLVLANTAQAGFGVSPGHIFNDRLYPGASFETKFILSRSSPTEDFKAEVWVEGEEIKNWFSFSPGNEVLLPKGEQRVPFWVKINVPKDAQYKNYKGYLNIRTKPAEGAEGEPGVAILLGATLDVDLTVTKLKVIDFKIRNLTIFDSEQGFYWWRLRLPTKVRFSMNVENIGNVEAAPNRVEIEVWDLAWNNLITKGTDLSLKKTKPFEKKDVEASFWLKLPAGNYWTLVRVFKDQQEILREEKLPLKVVSFEMSSRDWLMVTIPIIILMVILIIIFWKKGFFGKLIFRIKRKDKM